MTPDDETPKVGTQPAPIDEENTTMIKSSEDEVSDVTEASPTNEDADTSEPEAPKKKLGMGGILKALAGAVKAGQISSRQARQMRSDLGILGSFFTKPSDNVKAKRAKRLAAKKARKVTYRKGYKGQKMNKGGKR